jgi:hypothetical protein
VCTTDLFWLRYHLFGPTVDFAKYMEASSEKGLVHISDSTRAKLVGTALESQLRFVQREVEVVKGQGLHTTYFVSHSA